MNKKRNIKKLKSMLEPDDVILEEGSNNLGSFIKCTNGKLLMTCINGGFPIQPVRIPKIIEPESKVIIERWK